MASVASSWSRFEPLVRVVPRYLSLALSGDERMALEDVIFDRLGIASLIDWRGPTVTLFDLELGAAPLEALALEVVGRAPSRLLRVEGLIPFDWDVDGSIKMRDVEAKMAELPHLVSGPGPFRYFGADEGAPPFLWTSFESPG